MKNTLQRNEYLFRWNWENYGQTALRMVYAPGDYSILDRVQIRGNVLSGYLDGWDNLCRLYRSKVTSF